MIMKPGRLLNPGLHLRSATADDCRMIWEWANDPLVRAASFSSGPIPWDSHVKWFSAKLAHPDHIFFIALDQDDLPIGQVRYEVKGREATVSVSLAPEQRGKGYGSQIIQIASREVIARTGIELIHAYIKPDNGSSISAFEKAGYTRQGLVKLQGNPALDFVLHKPIEKTVLGRCPICNSADLQDKFTFNGYEYKQCKSCEMLFVVNDLSITGIQGLYAEGYYEANRTNTEGRKGYPSYLAAQDSLKDSFRRKLDLVRQWVPSGRLLDAGTAYGTFLQLAAEHFDCLGLEVSPYAASVAQKDFGLDVRVGDIGHAPFPDADFDVIVMWDTIEHLQDPLAALKEVHRMLKPGGFCFVSTDDVSNWLVKLLGKKWWSIAPPLHLCHFSRRGMRIAFERAGRFELVGLVKDPRRYSLAEIIKHFGVSYQSRRLTGIGLGLGRTPLGKLTVTVTRPEQFIAVARRGAQPEDTAHE